MERNEGGNVGSVSGDICLGRLAMYSYFWAMEFYGVVDFLEACNCC
jgi:hypothetical protein